MVWTIYSELTLWSIDKFVNAGLIREHEIFQHFINGKLLLYIVDHHLGTCFHRWVNFEVNVSCLLFFKKQKYNIVGIATDVLVLRIGCYQIVEIFDIGVIAHDDRNHMVLGFRYIV